MEEGCSGRWVAAARWSGTMDLRPVLERLGGPEGFERARGSALLGAGLSEARVAELLAAQDGPVEGPCVLLGRPGYPEALLELRQPPPVIWCRGQHALLQREGIAIVGARACTPSGLRWADRVGTVVARSGAVVVSGAARGIDTAAHRGALGAEGATLAVLGCGLDDPSVRRSEVIREIQAAQGLLISEFPPGDPPTTWTFPRRNRLIAALGAATVVVEASERSGSLHTARFARELGRELFAVPGRPDAPASVGALGLIAEGATLMMRPADVLSALGARGDAVPIRLRNALRTPGSVEAIATRAGLDAREVLRTLVGLELTGLVRRLPDQRYAWI